MQMIDIPDKYDVKIGKPYWEAMKPKDGDDARMALVLPLTTEDGELGIFHRLNFTRTIITGGQNKGRALYDVSANDCLDLGMSAPFAVDKIGELEGHFAQAVVEGDEYDGEVRMRVKYLNPRRQSMGFDDAAEVFARMTGEAVPKPKAVEPTVIDDDDDLPFV